MAIHSVSDLLLLAAAGAFGGYTYWTFTNAMKAIKARVRAKR